MNRHLTLALALLGTASGCMAGEVGVGVAVNAGDYLVFVPWKARPNLLVEGFAGRSHSTQESTSNNTNYLSTSQSFDNNTVGVGLFWLQPLLEQGRLNLGIRLAHVDSTQVWATPASLSTAADRQEFKQNGYLVTPTLGFEYFVSRQLSVGGEVGYAFGQQHGSSSSTASGLSVSSHGNNDGTVTRVILRWYF